MGLKLKKNFKTKIIFLILELTSQEQKDSVT